MTDVENKNKISSIKILKKVNTHIDSKRKIDVLLVFILSIFSTLAESISIVLLIPFISFFINPETYLFNNFLKKILDFFNITDKKDILGLVSLSFIVIVLLSGIIKLKYIDSSNKLTDNIASDFRIKIFKFLINQDFDYYFKHGSNEIMSNLAQKTGSFSTLIFSSMNILNSILISAGIITVLVYNEPFYTPIIILTIISFFFIFFKIKSKSVYKKGENLGLNQNFIIDIFENTVGYLQEIFIYNLKSFFSSILVKASKETAKSSAEIRSISMFPKIFLETFVIIFVVMLIYFSNFSERSISTNISYLAILAFGAQRCLPLINQVYQLSINFRASTPIVNSYLQILESGKNNLINDKNFEKLNFNNKINLENLYFKYDKNLPFVLDNKNIEIFKGDKIAIKGRTGSGKSTIINLISGLLSPSKGKMLIDNVEINSKNLKNWQKNIAIVPQSIFLNDASILENIAIGINYDKIDFNKVKISAKLACIESFIESLPKKYNEKVGEKGIKLSGGQRQRIGIARAVYRNADVLILDEPTNALDQNTEEQVINNLTSLNKKITILMISHSNNSLKYFDKIIDLDKSSEL